MSKVSVIAYEKDKDGHVKKLDMAKTKQVSSAELNAAAAATSAAMKHVLALNLNLLAGNVAKEIVDAFDTDEKEIADNVANNMRTKALNSLLPELKSCDVTALRQMLRLTPAQRRVAWDTRFKSLKVVQASSLNLQALTNGARAAGLIKRTS